MDQQKRERLLYIAVGICLLLAVAATAALIAVHNLYRAQLNEQALQASPGAAQYSGFLGSTPATVAPALPDESGDLRDYYCLTAFEVSGYAQPDQDSQVLAVFSYGDRVSVLEKDGLYYRCLLENGQELYVLREYFTPRMYDYPLVYVPGAQDLRVLIPDAEFDILFASPNNITGHAMYAPIPILENTTAGMLYQASVAFQLRGYKLKIYDSYRPKRAQFELYDIVQDPRYIADPYTWGSWHNMGRAVDISLIDLETGEELEMPTPMHTFHSLAQRGSRDRWTPEQQQNVDLMTDVMVAAGFKTIETEWWHFEYTGSGEWLENDMYLDSGDYYWK